MVMANGRAAGSRSRFFELTSEEWAGVGLGSIAFTAIVALVRADVTFWPALGLLFTAVVFGHMCMTCARYVAFPDLVTLAACMQWVLAPWLADAYPPDLPMFRNALPVDEYLSYALPATILLWTGLHLVPNWYLARSSWDTALEPLEPRVRKVLDGIIVLGVLASSFSASVPVSLSFLVYLLASFRFFAALGWMVTETPGWPLRVGVVFALLLIEQTTTGIFYLVVHWGGFFTLVYAFMRRWRWRIGATIMAGLLLLVMLQQIKPAYRERLDLTWGDSVASLQLFGSMMWDRIRGVDDPGVEQDVGDTLVRFNQGWIISKIMTYVPRDRPFAGGETIADAVRFSILPRFLFPDKGTGASQDMFLQYTGVTLPKGTTMGLGIIGEMYANFGRAGGIAATFVYALLLGAGFTFFARRALLNPLWWAVGSVVLLPAVEPGINLEDISNHVVKGAVVLLVLWKLLPPMQRLLALAPSPAGEGVAEQDDDGEDGEYAPGFHDGFADPPARRL
ncbi:MAG: hypothetical protein IT176_11645 [Acidobacteria bacterium]|nr:hypothetical protein [Acidobacteriota bacterium]